MLDDMRSWRIWEYFCKNKKVMLSLTKPFEFFCEAQKMIFWRMFMLLFSPSKQHSIMTRSCQAPKQTQNPSYDSFVSKQTDIVTLSKSWCQSGYHVSEYKEVQIWFQVHLLLVHGKCHLEHSEHFLLCSVEEFYRFRVTRGWIDYDRS